MEIIAKVEYVQQTSEIYARLYDCNGNQFLVNGEIHSIVMSVTSNYLQTHKKMIEEQIAKSVRKFTKEEIVIKFEYQ